ncbi:hypothetical protein J437_LFUL010939 [Ladona fulva]|uniref:SCAN domain-containing protein 3 n=1 Tax=Ladona fulva TaxID=123851 RepID=A0A8K0K9T3_LADFU|nr:hypothetical protein J437_LFUL010939 [Ladona fulva]
MYKKHKDLSYFRTLKEKFIKQPTLAKLFSTATSQDGDGLLSSYNILLMIAKLGKPHTIGEELIIPAISEVMSIVLHKPVSDIMKKISLSNNTVQRRIDEMAQDVEDSLAIKKHLGNEALLFAYVRFTKEEQICQELLFAKYLQTDTKGESIFHALDEFFKEKEIPLSNILKVATDGAPAMVGRYRGFLAYLKKEVPNAFTVHYHPSACLHNSLQCVIKAINTIRRNSLNDRLFKQLCIENDEEFNCLLLHTEVRWLSKGACLDRFYKLSNSVLEFLKDKHDAL